MSKTLREQFAELSGIDLAKATVADAIRLDRVVTLRLFVADRLATQEAGGEIDVRELAEASKLLDQLLPPQPAKQEAPFLVEFRGAEPVLISATTSPASLETAPGPTRQVSKTKGRRPAPAKPEPTPEDDIEALRDEWRQLEVGRLSGQCPDIHRHELLPGLIKKAESALGMEHGTLAITAEQKNALAPIAFHDPLVPLYRPPGGFKRAVPHI